MKKFSTFASLSFSAFLLLSCTQMKKQMKQTPSKDMTSLMESVGDDTDGPMAKKPKTGEYTHEMAEANAPDGEITREVGDSEIDAELPGSESDSIPYSRSFLAKKKTKRMEFWVEYFTKKERARFQRFINNGEEYRHHIEAIFQEHGLPKELYYVGLIESGYYLGARSHASAVGPWQFIRGTGSRYGLRITREIDERQDLFKASHAAAAYFKDLHNIFSSWELALAAYNAGENGIIRRIMKHGTRDFYRLSRNKQIPSETINYVPKVLAAMHVIQNAQKYGFDIPQKKYRFFDQTELKATQKNVPLKNIADRMNVSVDFLKKLNPELRRPTTPRYLASTYYLRVPKSKYTHSKVERIEEDKMDVDNVVASNVPVKLSRPESKKELVRRTASTKADTEYERPDRPKFHRVRRGETLLSISRKYKMTPRSIAETNNFKSWKTRVRVGQRLTLEASEAPAVAAVEKVTFKAPKLKSTNKPIVYKVTKGDSLIDLARMFNIRVSKIKKVNNLKRGQIVVGQKIILPNTQKAIYTVRPGDHLTKVAKDLNTSLESIVKLNSLKKRTIYPGQKIIVNMD